MLLQADSIVVEYGRHRVLRGLTFEVQEGEIVAILGPNGAGKTTTASALSGQARIASGTVSFNQRLTTNRPDHEMVKAGLAHVPEGRHVFARLSVEENLLVGAYTTPKKVIKSEFSRVIGYFPALEPKLRQKAGQLSGGQQQMLAVGRALMSRPRLLVLDEPSMGLAPIIIEQLGTALIELNRQEGVSVLLIDQRFALVERIASRAYVLKHGVADSSHRVAELSKSMLESLYLSGRTALAGGAEKPVIKNGEPPTVGDHR
jgi:branched-chain amino acid transport system ATP-binding protein